MTTQIGDRLVDGDSEYIVKPFPLSFKQPKWGYHVLNGREVSRFQVCSTANWRGYVARWEIKNEVLVLVGFSARDKNGSAISIDDEFGKEQVAADWYSGELRSSVGNRIYGLYEPTYEKNCIWLFESGRLKERTVRINNTPEDLERTAKYLRFNDSL